MTNKLIIFFFLLQCILYVPQSKNDSIQFKKISNHILNHGKAYDQLYDLSKNIGDRLSGSEAYEKSVIWAQKQLKQAGADIVVLQEVKVPVWKRGNEILKIKIGNQHWRTINFLSLGSSEGTKGKDLLGELVVVTNKQEFDALPLEKVKDKIVLFNFPMNQDYIITGNAYGEATLYRRNAASWAGKKGAKAVLIRSLASNFDDVPHTGNMKYDQDDDIKIPAGAIGTKTADELQRVSKLEKISVKLNSNCTSLSEKNTHTVIGEIKGSQDNKIIVIGAHLDSWDVGEGASDDGAGIVQAFEILRTFKALGIQPKHTIRVVCYANEENGVRGGITYAKEAEHKNEQHLFAIESDAGGFSPRGIALVMSEEKRKQIQSWSSLFLPYGAYDFTLQHAGTDIQPLEKLGVPTAGLVTDSQRYFDIHHTPEDTFDKVNRRELLLGAVVMAQMVYMIDKYW